MAFNPLDAYIKYTKAVGKYTGATQMGKDAAWAVSHPLDRLMGRGRAANGQMMIPAGPGGGFIPKMFARNPQLQQLAKASSFDRDLPVAELGGGGTSPVQQQAHNMNTRHGQQLERLRDVMNTNRDRPIESMTRTHAKDYAEVMGMSDYASLSKAELARMRKMHVAQMLRERHAGPDGFTVRPTGRSPRGQAKLYDKPPTRKLERLSYSPNSDKGDALVPFYHALLKNLPEGAFHQTPMVPAARAMMVQDMLKGGMVRRKH